METNKQSRLSNKLLFILTRFVLVSCLFFIFSCGSSDDDEPTPEPPPPPPPKVSVSGLVQKGPFIDLHLEVFPIQDNGQMGPSFTAQTDGSQYRFEAEQGQVVNVQAWGTFVDELSGQERSINQDLPLQSTFEVNGETQNVNILTTLSTLVAAQNDSGLTLDTFNSAQTLIAQGLGFEETQHFSRLDINQIEDENDPSFRLLTLGGALLQQDPEGLGLPSDFLLMLDLAQQGTPVESIVTMFNGIDVGAVYAAVQQAQVITNLPPIENVESTTLLCEPICQFIPNLGPTVSVNDTFFYEGQGRSKVKLSRTGDKRDELSVNISFVNQSATSEQDFSSAQTSVSFASGEAYAYVEVEPILDNLSEGDEHFQLQLNLAQDSNYSLRRAMSVVTIKDGLPTTASLPTATTISSAGCYVDIGAANALLIAHAVPSCAGDLTMGTTLSTQDNVSLQFLAAVTADCNNGACGSAEFWPFKVVIEALDPQNNNIIALETLGDLLYPRQAVTSQDSPPSQARLASIPAATVSGFISDALQNNHLLRIRLQGSDSSQNNIVAADIALPRFAPTGTINFGSTEFELAPEAILTKDSSCPNADDFAIKGRFESTYTIEGQSIDYAYEGEVCASYVVSTDGQGTWQVSQSDIDISSTAAFLPEDLYVFIQSEKNDGTNIRSSLALPFTLPLTAPNNDVVLHSYISADALPFGLRISGLHLTENGIQISYDSAVIIDHAGFYADDPRTQSAQSNTVLYATITPGTLILDDIGISGQLNFTAGEAQTTWPKGHLRWQDFSLQLNGRQMETHHVNIEFEMAQNLDCSSFNCIQGRQQIHKVSGTLNINSQGDGIGAMQYTDDSLLAWGAINNNNAWELVNALQTNTQVTLVIPGFTQAYIPNNSQNVIDGLMAHRDSTHRAFAPSSEAFSLGNYFAPGLTVGPELYANSNGQPEMLTGTSLANLAFALNDKQGNRQSITTHDATKFVIQNAGITGVVNANPSSMPSIFATSGFDIELDRFALRTQNNVNDAYNWIDGDLRLEGDAKIDLAFNNLALACDGSLGKAQMLSQACDGGVCRLESWRADIDIFALSFTDQNGEALACSNETPVLTLEHDIDFKALDKRLAMTSSWDKAGLLLDAALNQQSQYRFDNRSQQQGYPLILESASLQQPFDLTQPEALRYGTLQIQGKIGVPFWLPLESDIRVANTLSFGTSEAEPSVVVPTQTFNDPAFTALEAALNIELQGQILENEQFDFDARYEWGSTGFGFQLPVFYNLASSHQNVSFLGRKREIDLFVLNAGAGIDFIEPARTKLSFGASADFAALKQARFQIDLGNTEGLKKVDELLVQANIIQTPIITPTFESISNVLSIVNDVADQGLEVLMEKLLLQAVTRAGEAAIPAMPNRKDPFETLADSMAMIKHFPNHLIAQTDELMFDPVDQLLDEQQAYLRSELLDIVQQVENIAPGEALQTPLKNQITLINNTLITVEQNINQVLIPVEQTLDSIVVQITDLQAAIQQTQEARDEVEVIVSEIVSVVDAQCGIDGSVIGSESAGYLEAAFQQLDNAKQLMQILSASEALATLADLIVDDPDVKASMADTQDTLKENASALMEKIAAAEVAIRDKLCQSNVQNLLLHVNQMLQQIDNHISQIQQLIQQVDGEISIAKNRLQFAKTHVLTPISHVKIAVNQIETELNQRLADVSGAVVIRNINSLLEINTGGQINVIVARNQGESDIFTVAFALVKTEIASTKDEFITQLRQQAEGLFPYGDMSADQLRRQLVQLVLSAEPVKDLRQELNKNLVEIIRKANEQVLTITDQANSVVQEALAKVENEANKVLEEATASVKDIPLDSAKLDGFAVIAGNELERAHVGAEWTMSSSDESEPGNTFGAALDAVSWAANGKAQGCAGPGTDSNLDITISAMGIPAKIGPSDITIKKVYLGFTLASAENAIGIKPIGVNGGISTTGDIGFTEFVIYDPAFAAGIGLQEVYLGAAAGAVFSDIQAEVAFLVGKTCNQDVLLELDPNVAQYIPIPASGFTGAYVRGAASVPVYTNGCPLTVGVAADIGAWILKGPPLTIGGLVGGGAFGTVGCVGALRGQLRALGQVNSDGDFIFVGQGFGAAGLGLCEPAGWTSLERSRQDDFCGTADAVFTAGYINGWSVLDLSAGAIF